MTPVAGDLPQTPSSYLQQKASRVFKDSESDTLTRQTPISAISATKNLNYSVTSDISTKNIVLKEVNFSRDAAAQMNNKDFLNQLDEEIKITEENVKHMNERFE